MPRIDKYVIDENISGDEFVIGTDADNKNKTKNYRLSNIASYIKSEQLDVGAIYLSGLTFDVYAYKFPAGNSYYSSTRANVTLEAADPTNPRIDLIVANIDGTVGKITGIPNVNPSPQDYDSDVNYVIKFVLVNATATTLNEYSEILILDEGTAEPTEWSRSYPHTVGAITSNDPYTGVNSLEFPTAVHGNRVDFTHATPINSEDIEGFSFWIKLKEAMTTDLKITCYKDNTFLNFVGTFPIPNGKYGFDGSSLVYQQVTVNGFINANKLNKSDVGLIYIVAGYDGHAGCFIDDFRVQLNNGSNPTPQDDIESPHPTHTSAFTNDGSDGVNPYITASSLSSKQAFTATAGQTVFSLSGTSNNVDVQVDRGNRIETIDYVFSGGNTVTMNNPQDLDSIIVIRKY